MSFTRKRVLISISALLIIGIVAAGSGVYLLTRSPEMEAEMRLVKVSTKDAHSLDQKLAALEEEIRSIAGEAGAGEVNLILSEAEVSILLTGMMKDAIAESPHYFSEEMIIDTMVNLDSELIRAVVEMEVFGTRLSAAARVQAVVDEKGLDLELDTIELGRFPFAGFVEDQIREIFNNSLRDISFTDLHIDLDENLPVELKDIKVREREMIITGVVS